MAKHKGGRPPKYEGEKTIEKVYAAAAYLDEHPEHFLAAGTEDQLGRALSVCGRETVLDWAAKYPEFSYALKTWKASQRSAHFKLAKTLPPAIWIFMKKNIDDWRDKQGVDLNVGGKLDGDHILTIKVVETKD